MKSLRDIINKMPETRGGLEDSVKMYSPRIDNAVSRNEEYAKILREETDLVFDEYSKYMNHWTHRLSAAGHAVGYTADAWLVTGDIVGSLGGKFINLLAQVPEKVYSVVYAARTGNYLDSLQNIFEGIFSYLPGFTVVDQGLARLAQKRMIKKAAYRTEKRLGIEHESWYKKAADSIRDSYTDVKNRAENVISPRGRLAPALATS